jgi:hypothetical protein
MSHPYDASTKYLVETRLADWLALCGRSTTAPVEIIDADLATITAAADRVLRVHESPPWLMHLELQSSRDADLPFAMLVYNALLERRHRVLVRSLVVLLRREADAGFMTGTVERAFPGHAAYFTFRYEVVRVWQLPVDVFLDGGLGILPLAPLSNITEADLPRVIGRIDQRLRQETTPEEAGRLWTAADVLMGLRYPDNVVEQVLGGIASMEDSVTYQAIVRKGKIAALQELLLDQGQDRFGVPDDGTKATLEGIKDVARLKTLGKRLLHVASWEELLAGI